MCMMDDAEGQVTLLSRADPVARKAHKCKECGREIAVGEQYHVDRFVWEGEMHNHKVCAHCMVARKWLSDECGGWVYGSIEEDVREHAQSGGYPMSVCRLAVGMAWNWRSPKGRLLPIPKVPPTTHERFAGA